MELTKELKEKIEKAATKEEARKIIENAGIVLDDAELDRVAGGDDNIPNIPPPFLPDI
ncbi:MAG: hypothetical protein J5910_08225 [Lachnospiraceae bacterium]|nr:hypothetical protein [Lachnospiraceae bacterium]